MANSKYIHLQDYEPSPANGFVRMLSSYNPEHDPTYIDEGNVEMFVVEQKDAAGNVDQLHLTPNQAFELRSKLERFLAIHFGEEQHLVPIRLKDMNALAA